MTVIATGFTEKKVQSEPTGKVVDLPRTARQAATAPAASGGGSAPAWRRRYGENRTELDDPLAESDYDVPTFLRRSAD